MVGTCPMDTLPLNAIVMFDCNWLEESFKTGYLYSGSGTILGMASHQCHDAMAM